MSDIFISYASTDRSEAKILSQGLKAQGWTVWWDRTIPAGRTFDEVIEEALDTAKIVIVLWSEKSVKSRWVLSEAQEGVDRNILIPVLIEKVRIPLAFRRIQSADLIGWDGSYTASSFQGLVGDIAALLGPPPKEEEKRQRAGAEAKRKAERERQQDEAEAKRKVKEERKRAEAEVKREAEAEVKRKDVGASEQIEVKPISKPTTDEKRPKAGNVMTNSIGMKLVYVPAGSFMMGSPSNEKGRSSNEGPQHEVCITEGFWMGQTEVTQGQYKSVMNTQPWFGKIYVQEDADNPAVYVSWKDAAEFCTQLSQQEGKTYRLPTEAEWEYTCRAGTTTRFSFGDSESSLGDYAWFNDNAYKVDQNCAHSVGQKKPNPWGLYDMHGNVWEWCSDWYNKYYYSISPRVDPKGPSSGDSRSLRGGSWSPYEGYLRSSTRLFLDPGARDSLVGFRVLRSQ